MQALLLAETPAHLRHRLGADTPRGAVSAMAGLAAAVEAFAVAETDLFALATRSRLAHLLPDADPERLRVVASGCARSLRAQLALLPAPPPPAAPAVRVVSTPGDLAPAQLQVSTLLTAPPAPPLLAQLTVGQARACLAAAALLRTAAAADQPHTQPLQRAADTLTRRARSLTDISTACTRVHGPPSAAGVRAVQQTGEVLRYLQHAAAGALPPTDTAAVTLALLDFTSAGGQLLTSIHRVTSARLHHRRLQGAEPGCHVAGVGGRQPAGASAAAAHRDQRRAGPRSRFRHRLGFRTPAPPAAAGPANAEPSAIRCRDLCAALDPRVVEDPHWPALAAALARAERAGVDVDAVARAAVDDRPLPAEHPARSLHYRLVDACDVALTPAPAGLLPAAAPPTTERLPIPPPAVTPAPGPRPAVPR